MYRLNEIRGVSVKLIKLSESYIYDNPMPVLRSRHSCFAYVCEQDDGSLIATHSIGEAFESVDCAVYISKSEDKGSTFSKPKPVLDKSNIKRPFTESMKMTNLGNGHLFMFGYLFYRDDPDLPISNNKTGGALPGGVMCCESFDYGESFSDFRLINCVWDGYAEASAPVTKLSNGDLVSPIGLFPKWDGSFAGAMCSRLMRSKDNGKNWDDSTVIMGLGDDVGMYEQRLTVLQKSGAVVVIAWNENLRTGERLNNHYAISYDNGYTFEGPFDTGMRAQSSSLCAIGGDRLIAFHAVRKDTDDPRVVANVVNLESGRWEIESSETVWRPASPIKTDEKMAETFNMLKFGQPGGILLSDGTIVLALWIIEQNQGKTMCMRYRIEY